MFIAIIGSRAAGKTSVRKYLETKGFRHVRVSSSEEVRVISRSFSRAHF
jgi:dephospho-CoA kinase